MRNKYNEIFNYLRYTEMSTNVFIHTKNSPNTKYIFYGIWSNKQPWQMHEMYPMCEVYKIEYNLSTSTNSSY